MFTYKHVNTFVFDYFFFTIQRKKLEFKTTSYITERKIPQAKNIKYF